MERPKTLIVESKPGLKFVPMWMLLSVLITCASAGELELPCDLVGITHDVTLNNELLDWCQLHRAHATINAVSDMAFVSFVWKCIDNYHADRAACFDGLRGNAPTDWLERRFWQALDTIRGVYRRPETDVFRSRGTMHAINLRRMAAIAALERRRHHMQSLASCDIAESLLHFHVHSKL